MLGYRVSHKTDMKRQRSEAARLLGQLSYPAKLKRLGIERLREIARENGKLGGRPPKKKGKRDER
jgi:hypothetical protein